jgi:hypothetical protein
MLKAFVSELLCACANMFVPCSFVSLDSNAANRGHLIEVAKQFGHSSAFIRLLEVWFVRWHRIVASSALVIFIYVSYPRNFIFLLVDCLAGHTQKNSAVLSVDKKVISHPTRTQHTMSAAGTVHVSHALPAVLF